MLELKQNEIFVVDVREADEFASERVPGSVNVPLSRFALDAPGVLTKRREGRTVFMCRSGKRATLAADEALRMGLMRREQIEVFQGGIIGWKEKGHPVERFGKSRLPILRQVQMVVGLMVFISSIGAILGYPGAAWISAVFGLGLFVAGVSGFCGLATVLSKMPWNTGLACELAQHQRDAK